MPELTVSDLRSIYGFVFPSSADAQFEELIATAERLCLAYLDRDSFRSASFIQYFDGGPQDQIVLDNPPILEVSSVSIDSQRQFGVSLAASDWRCDSKSGVLTLFCSCPKEGRSVIKVDYSAGWTETPPDIRYCIAATVQYLAKLVQSSQIGITSRTTEGGTESLEQSLPPLAVQKLLGMYRFGRAR